MELQEAKYKAPPFFFSLSSDLVIREAKQGLPFTLSPEYLAAQRAYMRYHNMNPIFGISSRSVVLYGGDDWFIFVGCC